MANVRHSLRTIFTILSTTGIVAILHEFGVKYAEQRGWYDNLPDRVEHAISWLAALTEPLWFKLSTALVVGFTLGLWIDAFLKRHEASRFTVQSAEATLGPVRA
jgi:hypothetical protein